MYECTFQPKHFTGCDSEGAKSQLSKVFSTEPEYSRLFHLLPGILPLVSNFCHLMSFSFMFLSADPFHSTSCFCLQIPFNHSMPRMNCISS